VHRYKELAAVALVALQLKNSKKQFGVRLSEGLLIPIVYFKIDFLVTQQPDEGNFH